MRPMKTIAGPFPLPFTLPLPLLQFGPQPFLDLHVQW